MVAWKAAVAKPTHVEGQLGMYLEKTTTACASSLEGFGVRGRKIVHGHLPLR